MLLLNMLSQIQMQFFHRKSTPHKKNSIHKRGIPLSISFKQEILYEVYNLL